MPEWVVDLSDVKPATMRSTYVTPGEYGAKISAATPSDTKYGNGVEFTFHIEDEGEHKGARLTTMMFIPDGAMKKALADDPKRTEESAENFVSMMASKWVSIMLAGGLKPGKHDLRKVAQKLVGKTMLIVVEDSKRRKPTDPVYSNVNGTLPLPADYKPSKAVSKDDAADVVTSITREASAADEDSTSEADDFDLDEIA